MKHEEMGRGDAAVVIARPVSGGRGETVKEEAKVGKEAEKEGK